MIRYKYKNISDQPLPASHRPRVVLYDPNGVTYHPDVAATVAFASSASLTEKVSSDLNPGLTGTGAAVFELAADKFKSGTWSVGIDLDPSIRVALADSTPLGMVWTPVVGPDGSPQYRFLCPKGWDVGSKGDPKTLSSVVMCFPNGGKDIAPMIQYSVLTGVNVEDPLLPYKLGMDNTLPFEKIEDVRDVHAKIAILNQCSNGTLTCRPETDQTLGTFNVRFIEATMSKTGMKFFSAFGSSRKQHITYWTVGSIPASWPDSAQIEAQIRFAIAHIDWQNGD